jgi:hypothetical protein
VHCDFSAGIEVDKPKIGKVLNRYFANADVGVMTSTGLTGLGEKGLEGLERPDSVISCY